MAVPQNAGEPEKEMATVGVWLTFNTTGKSMVQVPVVPETV